jgi:hypothetical protein
VVRISARLLLGAHSDIVRTTCATLDDGARFVIVLPIDDATPLQDAESVNR